MKDIQIKNFLSKELAITKDKIFLFQGKYDKKEILEIKKKIKVLNVKKSKIESGILIFGIGLKRILSEIKVRKKIYPEVANKLEMISNYFKLTNFLCHYKENFETLNSQFNLLLELISFSTHQKNLKTELKWADFNENIAKTPQKLERLRLLEKKNNNLREQKNKVNLDRLLKKKRLENLIKEERKLKQDSSNLNKKFMRISSEINKISREFDRKSKRNEVYNEKIKDLNKIIPKKSVLIDNPDWKRISEKNRIVLDELTVLKEDKAKKLHESKKVKEQIIGKRQKLKEFSKSVINLSFEHDKIENIYLNLEEEMKSYQDQLNNLYDKGYNGEKKVSITKPNEQRPEIIRYSNIIKSDIEQVNVSIKRILSSLKMDEMKFNDVDLKKLFQTFTNKIKADFVNKGLGQIKLGDLTEIINEFKIFIQNIETNINSFIYPQQIKINLFKLPFIPYIAYNENDKNMEDFGLYFSIYDFKQKKVIFDKLSSYKKSLLIIGFDLALSYLFNKKEYLFFDNDFDLKLTSKTNLKKLIENTVKIAKKGQKFSETKFLFFISKEKFRINELMDVTIINQDYEIGKN